MMGNPDSGISHPLRDTPYARAAGMLLHLNGKFRS